jgi:hypothetical protein
LQANISLEIDDNLHKNSLVIMHVNLIMLLRELNFSQLEYFPMTEETSALLWLSQFLLW